MRLRFLLLLSTAWIAASVSGCTIVEMQLGPPLPLDEIEDLAIGRHYSAVVECFGPPTKLSALSSGMVFQYEHVDIYETQIGLFLPGDLGKLIQGVLASADADVETMVFVFDKDGLLVGSDAESWTGDVGSGQGITLLVSAESDAVSSRERPG